MAIRKGGKDLLTMWRKSCQRQLLFYCDAISAQLYPPHLQRGKKKGNNNLEKRGNNNLPRTQVEQTKYQSTSWEMDFSKLFVWSSELLEKRQKEKIFSNKAFLNRLLSPVVRMHAAY